MSAKFKHCVFSIFVTLFFSSSFATPKSILPIQSWLTKSGTSVLYVHESDLPIIDIQVVFDAGSARDDTQVGIASMTNEALVAGTTTKNVDAIASAFDDAGAIYSAAVSRDMAVVALRSLVDPNYFTPAFAAFTEVLTQPTFPDIEFKRIQKQTLIALTQQDELPASIASKAFYTAVYNTNPYGHPVAGTLSSVSKLTAQDLKSFYKSHYTSQNALIAIVGAVDQKQAQQLAEEISSHLAQGHKLQNLVFQPVEQNQHAQHIAFPSSQTHVIIGQTGINRANPVYFPIMVGNYILGGSGMTSRLFDEVREKRGLAYSVRSQFSALKDKGPFAIELQTRNSEVNNAIKVVNQTLTRFLTQGPSDTEMLSAKKNLTQGFILRLASNSAIVGQLINIGFYNLPLNYLDTYQSNINNVTGSLVKTVFQRIVQPNNLITVTVGGNSSGQEAPKAVR
jgi:zinc protease